MHSFQFGMVKSMRLADSNFNVIMQGILLPIRSEAASTRWHEELRNTTGYGSGFVLYFLSVSP